MTEAQRTIIIIFVIPLVSSIIIRIFMPGIAAQATASPPLWGESTLLLLASFSTIGAIVYLFLRAKKYKH